ncbi:MAG: acyl-CoA thioesterase [Planctomycetota bacterium]
MRGAGYNVAMRSADVLLTRLVMPGQTNRHGSLFGGVAMSLMDEAAAILATRVARGPVVTVHIASIDFKAPVWEGEAVQVHARLDRIGRSSLHIHVTMKGEDMDTGEVRLCTEADVVMVAIDHRGRPRPVPQDDKDPPAEEPPRRPRHGR